MNLSPVPRKLDELTAMPFIDIKSEAGRELDRRPRYLLLTAVHNEERYIERTLEAVVRQLHKPSKWVIVNDRSTDRTGSIVEEYAKRHKFIDLLQVRQGNGREFSSKVKALGLAYNRVLDDEYDFIGILDGDVSFDPDYYENLLERFARDSALGLVGGFIYEKTSGAFASRRLNTPDSVAGATQFFRRQSFQAIGGLQPVPYGGEDWCAEIGVRMHGWKAQSFPELKVFHHRPTGTGGGLVRYWYRQGKMDYSLGSLVSFEALKCLRRLIERPIIVGALARWMGFVFCWMRSSPRSVPVDLVNYLRTEQQSRLVNMLRLQSNKSQ